MDLKDIMLSEISQTEKTNTVYPLYVEFKKTKNQTWKDRVDDNYWKLADRGMEEMFKGTHTRS